ncbi:MAG: [acyl-carrier-protein] S-malonyltransferase [Gammaproteobacteria bacterium]|nr:MAG: [acyl-carrier-protein] S-malonyltransferase [Gammaproteobacteria bacterium]
MTFAILFPGQGSQSVGMLSALAEVEPLVEQTFREASDALAVDLWRLVREGPEEELGQTANTQPAMLAAGVAVWRIWREHDGPVPMVMAGHSLGEYTALVCAGALDFPEAVALVADRGRFMQEAVAPEAGAMAAIIGLEDERLEAICREVSQGQVVSCANYNAPGQVVIAGQRQAVERAIQAAKSAGARRAVVLPVSVPSHCALMEPAAEELEQRLLQVSLRSPTVCPVLHNVDASEADGPDTIRQKLVAQLHQPVRWTDCVRAIAQRGAQRAFEFGPGKVLTGLCRRIDRSLDAVAVQDPASLEQALLLSREAGQ